MYKCKEIIELTSHNMDNSLPWYTRLKLNLHFMMCKTCKRYSKQLRFMQKALGVIENHAKKLKLSEQAKQRIKKELKQAQDQQSNKKV